MKSLDEMFSICLQDVMKRPAEILIFKQTLEK